MDKKEKLLFERILRIFSIVVSNVDERNIETVISLFGKLEIELRNTINESQEKVKKPKAKALPIWRNFANMTEEEIRREFSNLKKYPDLDSIKLGVKGFLPMTKVSKVKTRETLINHIIEEYRKREHIKEIGR